MICVGSTGGACTDPSTVRIRPSGAISTSPSRVTAIGIPSTRIRRVSTGRRIGRVPDLSGFFAPRSPEGRASIIPAPPWHYSGDVLTLEYRAEPGAVAAWLPTGGEPAGDPDSAAGLLAGWQSHSGRCGVSLARRR